MKYCFDEIVNRRGTYSLKWDGGEVIKKYGISAGYDSETLPLFTADMDFPIPQPVIDALHKTVDHRIFGYSVFPNEYYEAVQKWFQQQHHWDIKKEEMIYSPGTVHAINAAVRCFTDPGDGVIIQRPVYPPFTRAIEGNGRQVVNNALKADDKGFYTIDFEDFEEKAKQAQTKMFILCNPHNPTGRIFSAADLKKLAEICSAHEVRIVADEIHGDLIRRNQVFTPISKAAENNDHIITCTAINKTFNVAGLHCTNVVIPNPVLRGKFREELGNLVATPFAITALIAAYNSGEEWLEQLKAYIDDTIEWVMAFLSKRMPKVKVSIPEGTYLMWMDFSGYGLSPEEVHDRIYNKANVILEDGKMFGKEGDHYQRICLPSPRSIIQEAFTRIAGAFEDIH